MRTGIRWLATHTGVPAIIVAAVLVAIGYRVVKRTVRFAIEAAVVVALFVVASRLGWLVW